MLTIAANQSPWWFRAVNWMGHKGLIPRHLELTKLTESSLLAEASQKTGLTDFGSSDFLAPMRILLDSIEKEARLHTFGRISIRDRFVRLLSQRLLIQDHLKRFPEITRRPVAKPVLILGLPRTGTTLLHHLMAAAPGARAPLLWELLNPCPPPTRETRSTDPRIKEAKKQLSLLETVVPVASTIHPMNAEEAEECLWLFELSFRSLSFQVFLQVPTYCEYLAGADMLPLYEYHRTALQILQWQCPGDYWLLKTPYHLHYIDTIRKVYPDVRIVFTHRDPLRVVASACSLIESALRSHSDEVDPKKVGQTWMSTWGSAMAHAMAARKDLPGSQVYDLDYDRLMADPIAAARDIHRHFDLPFDPKIEVAMRSWYAKNAAGKHTKHRYELARYGLNPHEVVERFGLDHKRP